MKLTQEYLDGIGWDYETSLNKDFSLIYRTSPNDDVIIEIEFYSEGVGYYSDTVDGSLELKIDTVEEFDMMCKILGF